MRFKDLLLNLSKEDISNLLSLQDKIMIKKLDLGKLIKISGMYKIMGLNVDFDASMTICGFKNNIIYIDIKDFQISKKGFSNPLVRGSMAFLTKSINDVEGMNLNNNSLTVDVEKIIKFNFSNIYGVKLEKLDINALNTNEGYFEFGINILELSLDNLKY